MASLLLSSLSPSALRLPLPARPAPRPPSSSRLLLPLSAYKKPAPNPPTSHLSIPAAHDRGRLAASPLTPFSPRSEHFICKAEANALGEPADASSVAASSVSQFERVVELLTTMFPLWVILGTVLGIYKPAAVTWLQTDLFTLSLGFLMLSMGLTLTFEDFRRCLRNPWTVGVGFLAQYFVKPLLGFFIAASLKLSAPLATGLILVSCCPGGQASNVATYISKGNVALSVLMTTPLDWE